MKVKNPFLLYTFLYLFRLLSNYSFQVLGTDKYCSILVKEVTTQMSFPILRFKHLQ